MSAPVCRRVVLASLPLSVAAGCAKPHVSTVEAYVGGQMPRPDRVLVSYFAVSPEEVRLDQGISARITRSFGDEPLNASVLQAARDAQVAIANELVARLRAYGLPADLAGAYEGLGTALLVQGQIVGIDEGNRTRRTLIGLGAGKSSVTADSQLYYVSGPATTPRFLMAFEGEADSGRMPGAAETMGAGAVAGRVATSAALTGGAHAIGETRKATDTAEARNLANAMARRIGQFAVSQAWIPPAALQS